MIRHTLVVEGMPFLRYENNISEAICVQLVTVTVSTAVLPMTGGAFHIILQMSSQQD